MTIYQTKKWATYNLSFRCHSMATNKYYAFHNNINNSNMKHKYNKVWLMSISQECLWISSCLFSLIHGFFFLTVVDCDVVNEALEVPESSHSSNIQTPLRHFDWSVSPSLAALAIYVAFHSIEVVDKVGFIPTRWLNIEKKCFNKILSSILIFKSLQLKYFAMSSMELKVK